MLEPLEGLLRGDLIGDYVPEIVLSIIDTESLQVPPPSRMLIFTCDGGGILSPYQYDPGEWMGLELIGIQDLTGDGQGDLVFSDVNCGAHTCWHTPHVWSWTGNDFADAVTAPFQYPYPAFELRDAALCRGQRRHRLRRRGSSALDHHHAVLERRPRHCDG